MFNLNSSESPFAGDQEIMEHRWCKRWGLVFDVQLTSRYETGCVAHTRNVSMDGMFVELQPDKQRVPRLVHVQLPAAAGIPRLRALVVHTCEQGIGLMFCAVENRDRHLLARYLTETDKRHRAGVISGKAVEYG
jgi:PilZ domain